MNRLLVGVEWKDEPLPMQTSADFLVLSLERLSLLTPQEWRNLKAWIRREQTALWLTVGRFLNHPQIEPAVQRERFLLIPPFCERLLVRGQLDATLERTLVSDWRQFYAQSNDLKIPSTEVFVFSEGAEVDRRWCDPLWKSDGEDRATVWRVEGRHESRWVRKYSSEQLRELSIRSENAQHDFGLQAICFGHSQRWEQLGAFQEQIANRGHRERLGFC